MRAALYIHIPFCTRKCLYCDFYSVPVGDEDTLRRVLEAETAQLDYFLRTWKAREVPTLYIGGGTPSVVPRPLWADFLERVLARLPGKPEEFTVEANPETLDAAFLDACASAGVTRLSLGIQSFSPEYLRFAGRAAVPQDNRRAVSLLAERWGKDFSLDLMYGFPGQTIEEAREDAEEALAAKPCHLSLYALTVEEGTPLCHRIARKEASPVNEDNQENLRSALHELLRARGYENYEISSYSLPGKRCRHNTAYWNLRPYIGIGPAAVSTLPAASGPPGLPLRLSGKKDIAAYIAKPLEQETEVLSPRDFLADYLLMGLRTSDGIDPRTFSRIFGIDFRHSFSRAIAKNKKLIACDSPDRFTLTDKGRRLLSAVLGDFFQEIDSLGYAGPLVWPLRGVTG